jgi:hypothetical protein
MPSCNLLKRGGHRRVADYARPSAVANRNFPFHPDRQPRFHLDLRVLGRLEHRGHAATRGEHGDCWCGRLPSPTAATAIGRSLTASDNSRRRTAGTRRRVRSGRHEFRDDDRGVSERQRLQTLTRRCSGSKAAGQQEHTNHVNLPHRAGRAGWAGWAEQEQG